MRFPAVEQMRHTQENHCSTPSKQVEPPSERGMEHRESARETERQRESERERERETGQERARETEREKEDMVGAEA